MCRVNQIGYNLYQKLRKVLKARGINPYSTDDFVHASNNLILVVCVDDALIVSKKQLWIDIFIKSLDEGEDNFELAVKGNIDKCLGVEIRTYADMSYELEQPYLFQIIM